MTWASNPIKPTKNNGNRLNQKQFNIFLDDHQEMLYRMIRSRVSTEQDTEDILQEVLLKIYQNHASFKGQSHLKTWFYTICKNSISDYYRNPWWKFSWILPASEQHDNSHNNPEQQFILLEGKDRLLEKLATLPPQEKEVFQLRFFDDFSLKEIAECLGISLSTAKTHLYRALKKIRTTQHKEEILHDS